MNAWIEQERKAGFVAAKEIAMRLSKEYLTMLLGSRS